MPHPLRPLLVEDNSNTYPVDNVEQDQAGKVSSRNIRNLNHIGKRFDVDKQSPDYFEIDSIPDVWSRNIIFEMALFNSNHPLNNRITGEWRAMLATLALKDIRRLNLSSSEIILNNSTAFKKVLFSLLPKNTLDKNTPKEIVYIFKYNNLPIGMSHWNTLVCTACEYKIEKGVLSWVDKEKGFFIDPVNELRKEEKEALSIWLNNLWTEINNNVGDNFSSRGINEFSLSKVIQSFIFDLLKLTSSNNLTNDIRSAIEQIQSEGQVSLHNSQINLNSDRKPSFHFQGIYKFLDYCVAPKQVSTSSSHVRVIPSENRINSKSLLLIDKNISTFWNRPAHDILIHNTDSLANVHDDYKNLGDKKDLLFGNSLNDSLWVTDNDFFNDEIYVTDISGSIPASRGFADSSELKGINLLRDNKGRTIIPIIPLKKMVFDYFNADDIAKMVSFEMSGDSLVVRIKLNLSYDDKSSGRAHYIEKIYKINSESYIQNIPSMHIFPNFTRNDYKGYYTYFYNEGQKIGEKNAYFYAKPYVSNFNNSEISYYNKNTDFIKEEKTVNNLVERGFEDNTVDKTIDYQITRTENYPEAIECFKQENANLTSIGYIVIKKAKAILDNGPEFFIGIDFGTTSTNAYVREGHSTKPVSFSKDIVTKVFESSYERENESLKKFINFSSLESTSVPFLSLFRLNNLAKSPTSEIKPIFDGVISFLKGTYDYEKNRIKSDMKWSQDKVKYMKAFINQLAIMSAIDSLSKGASKIQFRFSYPSAFSRSDLNSLKTAIDTSMSNLNQIFSSSIMPTADMETEGLAATYFYAVPPQGNLIPRANFLSGVITVDIGGGTSDIAVVEGSNNEFKFRTSLKFAGRDIFLTPIIRNPEFLAKFGVSEQDIKTIKDSVGNSNKISADSFTVADVIVRFNSANILGNLYQFFQDDQVKGFIQIIRIGMAGLFYYMGSIIKYLKDKGIYSSTKIPAVYIGGNGSKVMNWLSNGKYTNETYDNLLFQCMLLHEEFDRNLKSNPERYDSDKLLPKIGINITPESAGSKPEVSYGLVVDRLSNNVPILNKVRIEEEFIAGENFKLKAVNGNLDKLLSKDNSHELINKEDLANVDIDSIGNSEFEKFIKIFNSCSRELEVPNIGNVNFELIKDNLKQDINTLVNRIQNDSNFLNNIQDEQVFFMTKLKLLLDEKINEWVRDYKKG